MGAEGFHGRVRDGIGCSVPRHSHQVVAAKRWCWWCWSLKFCWSLSSAPCGFGARGVVFQSLVVRGVLGSRADLWKDQADRGISTGQLHALPRFHIRPIDVVVYHGSRARPGFEGGFPLRCFQRLSFPYLATRLCRWRDNRSTRGTSIPVLSY